MHIPSRESLRSLVDAGFTIPEIKAFRISERATRIAAIKDVISMRLTDYQAAECLAHFDSVSSMPFRTLTESDFINSARSFAAIRN